MVPRFFVLFSPFGFLLNDEGRFISDIDDKYFARALSLARMAMGSCYPNPSVGAVIFDGEKDIASGYTQPAGGPHAERQALDNCSDGISGATIYVTLEPCSHFGRTPPCAKAIIDAGIKRVVFGTNDPNPKVDGSGIEALRRASIRVDRIDNPYWQKASAMHILPFRRWVLNECPYVVTKIATTRDHAIASSVGSRAKITCQAADKLVHRLRKAVDGIIVGKRTAQIDNPMLTPRLLCQIGHNQNPVRIVLAPDLDLDPRLHIFDTDVAKTILLTKTEHALDKAGFPSAVRIFGCGHRDGHLDLADVLWRLGSLGLTSVMIEPGAKLFKSIVEDRIADEVWWFRSQDNMGSGGHFVAPIEEDLLGRGYLLAHRACVGEDELSIFSHPALTSSIPNGCC